MVDNADETAVIINDLKRIGAKYRDEDWDERSYIHNRLHNWRRYINPGLREIWAALSDEARGVAFSVADDIANAEERE